MPVGGQVPVEVEVVGRSGCKGSWWANGGPGKVGGEGSPRDRSFSFLLLYRTCFDRARYKHYFLFLLFNFYFLKSIEAYSHPTPSNKKINRWPKTQIMKA